jgi:hypothetical protein
LRLPKPTKTPRHPGLEKGEQGLQSLNFKVPADFRRDFTTYATSHGLDLNELLKRAFESYRQKID